MSRIRLLSLSELHQLPQPEVLIPHALAAGELLIASGDRRFYSQLGKVLGQGAVAFTIEPRDRRWDVVQRLELIRRRDPPPAVLLYVPTDHPDYAIHWMGWADAVIDAETPTYARVVKLRNHDDLCKGLSLARKRAAIVEAF